MDDSENNPNGYKYWTNMPWYKKIPIIPVIILILLLAAWGFRWDYGPTQSFKNCLRIQYIHDNWTGQNWLKLYGTLPAGNYKESVAEITRNDWNNNWNSNTESWVRLIRSIYLSTGVNAFAGGKYPSFSVAEIHSKYSKIISSSAYTVKKESFEKKINVAQNKKIEHSQGHTQYLELEKIILSRFIRPQYYPSQSFNDFFEEIDEYNAAKLSAIEAEMPEYLKQECIAWRNADKSINNINEQIRLLPARAYNEAKMKLTVKSKLVSNSIVIIWWIVFATDLGYIIYRVKRDEID